ncbi:3D-(3,5/4)-trihydroxycyclohexane-1,2-dione acylhydrolase (decyclizing), partial [Dickeya dianthicola]
KGALVSAHPLNAGGIGVTGGQAANRLAAQADLVIGVGTRLTDFTTASKSLFTHPQVEFLLLNVAEFDAFKLDAAALVADAREGVTQLAQALDAQGYRSSWGDEIAQARLDWQRERQRLFERRDEDGQALEIAGHLDAQLAEYRETLGTRLTQTRVLGVLNDALEDDAIVVGAAGSLPGDLQRLWQVKTPDSYHLEYGYSCMGYEIAAAVGARLAAPRQPVYAMVGDGSYLMLHSELQTAVQEGIKITVLLFDNAGFGCINNLQMSQGMGSFCTENRRRDRDSGKLTGSLVTVDFARNAESYGCRAWTVRDEASLLQALREAQAHPGPCLLDIKVLPKTMTHGYDAWWNTGTAQVADNPAIEAAAREVQLQRAKARQY